MNTQALWSEIRMSTNPSMSTPAPVQVLSQEVIHRIAAGEVVDRPASVLKELIENSVDAGSTDVKVTIIEGGLKAIIVEDNGIGMNDKDLSLCLQRHATSKIRRVEDLDQLFSLGFRGEALAAISSVSEIEIHTYREGAGAWALKSRGGLQTYLGPGSQTRGTRVEVKDLFYNVPARKKFIKSTSAEARACIDVLEHLALCFPNVAFSWYSLKESTGDLLEDISLPSQTLADRVQSVVGLQEKPTMVSVSDGLPEGVLSLDLVFWGPPNFFATQKHITLCVNGRAVFDKRLGYSLREAYHGVISVGAFPAVHVNLEVNPDIIDANIHPQKKELRWPKGFSLAGLVFRQIRPYFDAQKQSRFEDRPALFATDIQAKIFDNVSYEMSPSPSQRSYSASSPSPSFQAPVRESFNSETLDFLTNSDVSDSHAAPVASIQKPSGYFSSMRVIGEAGARWILLESEKGLVVVDQHAAHERVNFERILSRENLIRSVPLLTPLTYKLPPFLQSKEMRESLMNALEEFGFEFNRDEIVSVSELEIIAVPQADRNLKWSRWLEEIIEAAERDQEILGLLDKIRTHVAASLACHSSVRFGQRLEPEQIRSLLESMDAVQWGRYCPHGRSVHFELSHEELGKRFDR